MLLVIIMTILLATCYTYCLKDQGENGKETVTFPSLEPYSPPPPKVRQLENGNNETVLGQASLWDVVVSPMVAVVFRDPVASGVACEIARLVQQARHKCVFLALTTSPREEAGLLRRKTPCLAFSVSTHICTNVVYF
jgi:hypothetical protein